MWRSEPQMPQASTSTTTSSARRLGRPDVADLERPLGPDRHRPSGAPPAMRSGQPISASSWAPQGKQEVLAIGRGDQLADEREPARRGGSGIEAAGWPV